MVSVVIPTLNGAATIGEVLAAIDQQLAVRAGEVIVIDSSSTDETVAIARAHGARVEVIAQADFGHGKTRQWGAQLAHGELVAFLTQDATPASPGWLGALVAPFIDPSVAGVYGRQIPRPGAVPLIRYDMERVFANPPAHFYSDSNSAARRAVLLGPVPYRDVDFSEDLCFAADVAAAGLRTVYAPEAKVWHSNQIRLADYAARMSAEARGHVLAGLELPRPSLWGAFARAVRGAARDTWRIVGDRHYRGGERLRWLVVNPAYHLARWWGLYRGGRGRAG